MRDTDLLGLPNKRFPFDAHQLLMSTISTLFWPSTNSSQFPFGNQQNPLKGLPNVPEKTKPNNRRPQRKTSGEAGFTTRIDLHLRPAHRAWGKTSPSHGKDFPYLRSDAMCIAGFGHMAKHQARISFLFFFSRDSETWAYAKVKRLKEGPFEGHSDKKGPSQSPGTAPPVKSGNPPCVLKYVWLS